MGLFRRSPSLEDTVKAVVAELTKAGPMALPAGTSTVAVQAQPANAGSIYQAGGQPSVPMPRLAEAFGSQLGPGIPLTPAPLDPVDPTTGRAGPRRYQYDVAHNLDLTVRRTPWQVLKALADQVDIIHRCVEIRVAEVIGLDWDFTLSDHAIGSIMADGNLGHAQAAKLGREKFGSDIDRLKQFFEAPLPGYSFSDWMTELLWNHYVYDAVAVYPECTLGGQVTGLMIVDGSTIKPLLDNRGMRPRPPAPAYQQILWGFPRGEYQESDPLSVDGEFNALGNGRISDQLAYFAQNRRTWDPYGFSTVEECIPAATLYMGRQRWLNAEYSDGATPATWMKLTGATYDPQQLAAYERVLNDMLAGNTTERHKVKALPDGFDPIPMPSLEERYKADYDEFIIKQVGSKFGIAPTQLGVIPRTGLAGRGQQQGEQDQAETISKKPTEEWIVDVINAIARRFLGSVREITATFNGGDSSGNALVDAQASQILVSTGQKTVNDLRGDNGDPLFDIPEADEPMIVTATGPVFLRGTLEAQLEPPAPPPTIHVLPPGAHGGQLPPEPGPGEKTPPDGSETAPGHAEEAGTQKQAEVAAFRRYIAKGRTRPFQWHHHTPGEVADLVKAATPPKGDARPGPGGHRETLIADHAEPGIAQALRLGLNPDRIAAAWDAHHDGLVKASVADPGNPGVTAAEAEASAWLATLATDPTALRAVLVQAHADGYIAGADTAITQLESAGAGIVTSDLGDAATSIDWDSWTPGDPATAQLVAGLNDDGGGLAELLARTDATITGIETTTLNRIGTALANSLAYGGTVQNLAATIEQIVGDTSRAATIATTETNRAMTAGSIAAYQVNGVQGFDWLASATACYLCQAEAEQNPHTLMDDSPPGHPNCRCAVAPVLIMPDGTEE